MTLKNKITTAIGTLLMLTGIGGLFFITPIIAAPTNQYYVTPTGSGTACTQSAPCGSITQASKTLTLGTPGTQTTTGTYTSFANVGAVVHVAQGTYNECVVTQASTGYTTHNGSPTQKILFVSDTQYGALIRCNNGSNGVIWQNGTGGGANGAYVIQYGFDISGDSCWGIRNDAPFGEHYGHKIHGVSHGGGSLCSSGGAGISDNQTGNPSPNNSHGSITAGNIIDDIGTATTGSCPNVHGVYIASEDDQVYNNIISRACGWGVQFYHFTARGLLVNNVLINNRNGGAVITASDGGEIADGYTVANNIVANNSGPENGIEERYGNTAGPNNIYVNNLFWGNANSNYFFAGTAKATPGTLTNGSDSTVFVNYTGSAMTGDYHLKTGSPAIGSGYNGACATGGISPCIPTTDLSGAAITSPPSRGVFNASGSPPPPPPPPTTNNYYVSPAGSGTACTIGSPCTLAQAITNTSLGTSGNCVANWKSVPNAGACIILLDGTYPLGHITFSKNGTATQQIVFIAQNKWGAKITLGGNFIQFGTGTNAVSTGANFNRWMGFDMTSPGSATVIDLESGNNRAIEYNYIHDSTGCGPTGQVKETSAPMDHDIFSDNVIRHWGNVASCDHGNHAFYVDGAAIKVTNNIISGGCCGWGIQKQYAGNTDCTPGVIANNTIFNNRGGMVLNDEGSGCGINHWSIINNIIVNNGVAGTSNAGTDKYGLYFFHMSNAPQALISNNIVYGNLPADIGGTAPLPTVLNTLTDSGPTATFTNFQADTNTNPVSGYNATNYQPKSSSAANKGGTNSCASGGLTPCVPAFDVLGNATSNPPTIGAMNATGVVTLPSTIEDTGDSGGSPCTAPCWKWVHDAGTAGSSTGASVLVTTPSTTGQSRQFTTTWNALGGERYSIDLGPSRIDMVSTNFVYDTLVQFSDLTHVNSLEFDHNQVLADGDTVIFGTQCNFVSGFWQYTSNLASAAHWNNSTIPCLKSAWTVNTWHHLTVVYHRNSVGVVTYDSVTFDGATSLFTGATVNSAFSLGWNPLGAQVENFQIDGDNTANGNVAYLDNFTVTGSVPGPAIAFVQTNSGTSNSGSTITVPYSGAEAAGDTNIIAVGWNDVTSTVSSVTDSQGNVYSLAIGPTRGTTLSQSIYYAKNVVGGADSVTVNFNQAAAFIDVRAYEYSGLDTTSPFDVANAGNGTGLTADSGGATTRAAGELIFGAGMTDNRFSGAGSTFTSRGITAFGDIGEDKVVAVTGTYNATAPTNSSGVWVFQVATFAVNGSVITQPNPAPTVTSISPSSGVVTGGNTVAIGGSGFLAGAIVRFGGTSATNIVVSSSTSITAKVPSGPLGAVSVTVTNTDNQTGTLTNGYTYTSVPITVSVTSIVPATGDIAGGTAVSIGGTGFLTGASVSIGSTPATSVVIQNSTTITAVTPAHTAGVVNVTVTNQNATTATLTGGYTYTSGTGGGGGTGIATIQPSGTINFGSSNVAIPSNPIPFQVTNTTAANINITSVPITGNNPGDFSKSNDNCTGANVTPGNHCNFNLTFTAQIVGSRSALVSVIGSGFTTLQATLQGMGLFVDPGIVAPSPVSLSFGRVTTATASPAQTVKIVNNRASSVTVGTITSDTGSFTIANNHCNSVVLAANGDSCLFDVIFTPASSISITGNISIPGTGFSTLTVPLDGIGITLPLPPASLQAIVN